MLVGEPLTELTDSCPARADVVPYVGNRPNVGRRLKRFVNEPGIRTEPPMSVPTPMNDPFNARRADSPPDEPPGDNNRL
jgi:hypothetical protein